MSNRRAQRGKHRQRGRTWHKGRTAAARTEAALERLPAPGKLVSPDEVDYTEAEPVKPRRGPGDRTKHHGDAL